jgi:hypothetical protein
MHHDPKKRAEQPLFFGNKMAIGYTLFMGNINQVLKDGGIMTKNIGKCGIELSF